MTPPHVIRALSHQLERAGVTDLSGVSISRRRRGGRTEYRLSMEGGPQNVLLVAVTEGGAVELPDVSKRNFKPELGVTE